MLPYGVALLGRSPSHIRRVPPRLVAMLALFAAACSSNPAAPSTPEAPSIACPAPQIVPSLSGSPVVVTYPKPIVTGGTRLMTVECNPPQSSAFPAGVTTVTCRVVDEQKRSASCSFDVAIRRFTKFVAFGDSITEGKIADPAPNGPFDVAVPYPAALESSLDAAFPSTGERITVRNEGVSSELVSDGLTRLPGVLSADNPDALLLLEGVNDLNFGDTSTIATVVDGLRSMVRMAKARDVRVYLATLTPLRPGGFRARAALTLVPPTNDQIRTMGAAEGVTVVDLYQGMNGSPDPWIDSDGLHPTQDGYFKIASIFFEVIRASFNPNPASPIAP